MFYKTILLSVLLALFLQCGDDHGHSHGHHQEGAHVHGAATFNLAVDGDHKFGIELRAPAQSIYGFEHEATSEADRATRDAALAKLSQAGFAELIGLDAGAGCRVLSHEVEEHSAGDGHDHDHEDEHAAGHREIHLSIVYECEQSLAGRELRPQLFQAFAPLETLQVQIITDRAQRSQTIGRDAAGSAAIAF